VDRGPEFLREVGALWWKKLEAQLMMRNYEGFLK